MEYYFKYNKVFFSLGIVYSLNLIFTTGGFEVINYNIFLL